MEIPNIVKVAVAAAGGRKKTAESLGLPAWVIARWLSNRAVPADQIRALCELTGGLVTVERLLEFIEQSKASRERA